MGNISEIVFFIVCHTFCFGFIEVLDSKGILNKLKKRYYVSNECADIAAFTFAVTKKSLFTLQVYCTRSDGQ